MSILISLIYTQHIACAEDDTPILAPEIHTIYHRDTQMSLAELLQDTSACKQAYRYMKKISTQQKFKVPPCAARWNHLTYRRMDWQSLDKFFIECLTAEQRSLEASKPADFIHDSDFKALLIANALFQQKWFNADPEIFKQMFEVPDAETVTNQSATTSEPDKPIPCISSEQTVQMYTRGF
jgi:hypothetical protein